MRIATRIYVLLLLCFLKIATPLPSLGREFLHHQVPDRQQSSLGSYVHDNKVPGDSPAHFNGNTSSDILTIDRLDLIPNPPIAGVDEKFLILLKGNITSEIGPEPMLWVTTRKFNKTEYEYPPRILGSHWAMKIFQNGTELGELEPPKKGQVTIAFKDYFVPWIMRKAYYTVRIEMRTTEGKRMTDFEGTIWVDGTCPPKCTWCDYLDGGCHHDQICGKSLLRI